MSNYLVNVISKLNNFCHNLTIAHTVHSPKMKMISLTVLSLLKIKVLLSPIQKSAGQNNAFGHLVNPF